MMRYLRTMIVLLAAGAASAQVCLSTVTVQATAVSSIQANKDTMLTDAVQAALNEAIMQARGVYVTSSSVLWEDFRSSVSAGVTDLDIESGVSVHISSRFNGFIDSYEVLHRRELGDGVLEVTVSATVCLDERIAIGLPAGSARSAIINSLIGDVAAAGWQVVHDSPGATPSDHELLEFTLSTGVTYVAHGSLNTSFGTSHGMHTATISLTMNLVDSNSMQLAHAFTATRTGVGSTREQAIQMAGEEIGTELARDWNRVFLAPEQKHTAEFVFTGLRRAATRYSLLDIVAGISGVLDTDVIRFDVGRGEAVLLVELAGDTCQIAEEVPGYRRVLTSLVSCSDERATYIVRGD